MCCAGDDVAVHLLDKETLRVQMLLQQISTKELFIGMKGAETPLHFDERENLFFQVLFVDVFRILLIGPGMYSACCGACCAACCGAC